jgi:predicted permease
MDALLQDLRFAVRSFLRRPGFTLVALLTLTVGIGATTAVFSIMNSVLFKRVPGVPSADGIVEIARDHDGELVDVSYPLVQAMAGGSRTLDEVAAVDWAPLAVGGADHPEVRAALGVTASYFDVLGVHASVGRLFDADEATFPSVRPVVVISQRLREIRLPDATIPGATLVLNGVPVTVVGVAGDGFRGHAISPVDVFVPLGLPVPGLHSPESLSTARAGDVEVLAHLRPGASAEAAAEELSAMGSATLAAELGSAPARYRIQVDPWGPVPAMARGYVAAFLAAMLFLVCLVLAMACTNVAGMVLSRSVERADEIAVRAALGAGRQRIVRQLLTESLVLAAAAGGLALALAMWVGRLLLAFQPPLPPGFELALDMGLDWRVLGFAFVAALGSAVVFNLAPALGAARIDVIAAIRGDAGSGRTRTRGRSALVAGQMALSLVLLVTAGLFLRTLAAMREVDPGWRAEGVWTADLDLELTGTSEEEGATFFRELSARLASAPGVAAAGLAHKLPLASSSSFGEVNVEGVDPPAGRYGFDARTLRITPGYLAALDLALVTGRDFGAADVEGSTPVALVNETMARRLWPQGDAVGRTFHLGSLEEGRDLTVVGVVEDARYQSMFEATPNAYYLPLAQWYNAHMLLFVRPEPGRGEEDVRARVAGMIHDLDPNLPVEPLAPLSQELALYLAPQRIAAWVSGALGLLALLLGAVGVYGVTAYAVRRRIREIGVRRALGATRGRVLALILRQGMVAPLLGLFLGMAGALVVARLVSTVVPGVRIGDPAALGGAVALLLAVAAAATLVPAWRAAREDPVETLRAE